MADTGTFILDRVSATSRGPAREAGPLKKMRAVFAEWNRRRWYRADLKRLVKVGPYMIADIGLTLEEAVAESEKPFWHP
ncbi:MAG: hypothetical protein OEM59_14225 [Rhodospirillales bacterium]|nr:hypothetical protein [Rhodospirillales bacterium]